MVSRSRSKKNPVSKALFMPLSVLELEVEHMNKRELQKVKESKACYPITELFCNPIKNVLALFLAEVLFRIVKDTEPDPQLFNYLYKSIHLLEHTEDGVANFHLVFLLGLLRYMGVSPHVESYQAGFYFDMLNGVFTDRLPTHRHYLNRDESTILARLFRLGYENMTLYTFSRQDRVHIIGRILEYYRLHLLEFPEIKSLSVMQSLFD